MSVEETLQPSFTVTAELQPPQLAVISQNSDAASESYDSYANRPLGAVADTSDQTTTEVAEVESESLQQWTLSQQKANGSASYQESVRSREGVKVADIPEEGENGGEGDTDMGVCGQRVRNRKRPFANQHPTSFIDCSPTLQPLYSPESTSSRSQPQLSTHKPVLASQSTQLCGPIPLQTPLVVWPPEEDRSGGARQFCRG